MQVAIRRLEPSAYGEWDLLYAVEGQSVELYRSKEDADHQHDLSETYPEIVKTLHGQYVEWLSLIDTTAKYLATRRQL